MKESTVDSKSILTEFQQVYHRVFRRVRMELMKHVEKEMSTSQSVILETLVCSGSQKVADLAAQLQITSGAVTGLCDKLIAAGYVERKRDEEDRRVVYIDITPEGRNILVRVKQSRLDVVGKIFGSLSDEDMYHLIRIYNQVLSNIEPQTKE